MSRIALHRGEVGPLGYRADIKARKLIQCAGIATGAVSVGLLVGGLVVTRFLPPWVPLSWRPRRLVKSD